MKFLKTITLSALSLVSCVLLAQDNIISTKGGISLKTKDGKYSAKLGGRIQYDYNRAEENNIVDEDGFDIRRARLFVSGHVGDFSYKAQFNIGDGNGGTPEDLYIRYNGFGKQAIITVGHQRVQFGLEDITSSNDISFLERSAITERYAVARQDSIRLSGKKDNFTYSISAFEDDAANDDDFGIAGRVTWVPIKTDENLLHLGASYTDRGGDVSAFGIETAYTYKAFHFQGEYVLADEEGTDVDGYYLQAGYILTGETRPYTSGKFKRVKGKGDYGAWEVVARYEDGDGAHSDIELGTTDATAIGLGVNWYYKNLRIGVNYTFGEDNLSNDEGSEFRVRTQYTF